MSSLTALSSLCIASITNNIQRYENIPESIPPLVVESLFDHIVSSGKMDESVLKLFWRSSMHSINLNEKKFNTKQRYPQKGFFFRGLTIDDFLCTTRVLVLPNNPHIQQIYIHKAPYLNSLSLRGCNQLEYLFICCPSLSSLELPFLNNIVNILVECCAEILDFSLCKSLHCLSIKNDEMLDLNLSSCITLRELTVQCNKLKYINLAPSESETIALHTPEITSLTFNFFLKLQSLVLDCNNLKTLFVSKCSSLTRFDLYAPNLVSLHFSFLNPQEKLELSVFAPNLKHLYLSNNVDLDILVTHHAIQKSKNSQDVLLLFPQLEHLDLSNCVNLNDFKFSKLIKQLFSSHSNNNNNNNNVRNQDSNNSTTPLKTLNVNLSHSNITESSLTFLREELSKSFSLCLQLDGLIKIPLSTTSS